MTGDRMRLRGISFLAASACMLAGCHQPMSTPKPPTFQSSEITVRDWKNAADDVASALASVRSPDGSPAIASRPVFVEVLGASSLFLHEAVDELEGDIIRRGGSIVSSPDNAILVSLDVDVVRWASGDLHASWGLFSAGTNTEAVLKARVVVGNTLAMKLVEPIYVRNGDVALYEPQPMPLPTRVLRYDP